MQMPKGVPVATVAIGNAANAGLLAVRMLAASDSKLQVGLLRSMSWSGSRTHVKQAHKAGGLTHRELHMITVPHMLNYCCWDTWQQCRAAAYPARAALCCRRRRWSSTRTTCAKLC